VRRDEIDSVVQTANASTEQATLLKLDGAGVAFGRTQTVQALSDVSLHIRAGERVALIGANGCGKSTLLRVLHGLMPLSTGRMECEKNLAQAMVFQRPRMLRMSARNNVAIGLWLGGVSWADAKLCAVNALQGVGLGEVLERPAHKLSGGQQQRLALARACARQPQLLLLDEPTSSLDPHAKREVEALVQRIAAQDNAMTLVFASHNLGQVKRLATRVVYLEQGRVLADLPVKEFFEGTLLQSAYPQAYLFIKGELA
jgi:tungstate transport system ATP-binding protein